MNFPSSSPVEAVLPSVANERREVDAPSSAVYVEDMVEDVPCVSERLVCMRVHLRSYVHVDFRVVVIASLHSVDALSYSLVYASLKLNAL